MSVSLPRFSKKATLDTIKRTHKVSANLALAKQHIEEQAESDIQQKETESKNKEQRDTPFDGDGFKMAWEAFLKNLREEVGSPLQASVLEKCSYRLEGNQLVLQLFNPAVQDSVVETVRPILLKYLRDYLRNDTITLEKETIVYNEPPQQMEDLSKEAIFRKFTEKNPLLLQLQKDLGLNLK